MQKLSSEETEQFKNKAIFREPTKLGLVAAEIAKLKPGESLIVDETDWRTPGTRGNDLSGRLHHYRTKGRVLYGMNIVVRKMHGQDGKSLVVRLGDFGTR